MTDHDRDHRCEYAMGDDVCPCGDCPGWYVDTMWNERVRCTCACHRYGRRP